MSAIVLAVCAAHTHAMTKAPQLGIRLVTGQGVTGDAHMGATVKHRSRVARDPTAPNLRQVHLMHAELFDELRAKGFEIGPGWMGENITTRGVGLLALPAGTVLYLGREAVVKLTGLRNPCVQLEKIQKGLMDATLERGPRGEVIRKAGVLAIVLADGDVHAGDAIRVEMPEGPRRPLMPV